jgi:hypothetical protein
VIRTPRPQLIQPIHKRRWTVRRPRPNLHHPRSIFFQADPYPVHAAPCATIMAPEIKATREGLEGGSHEASAPEVHDGTHGPHEPAGPRWPRLLELPAGWTQSRERSTFDLSRGGP